MHKYYHSNCIILWLWRCGNFSSWCCKRCVSQRCIILRIVYYRLIDIDRIDKHSWLDTLAQYFRNSWYIYIHIYTYTHTYAHTYTYTYTYTYTHTYTYIYTFIYIHIYMYIYITCRGSLGGGHQSLNRLQYTQ